MRSPARPLGKKLTARRNSESFAGDRVARKHNQPPLRTAGRLKEAFYGPRSATVSVIAAETNSDRNGPGPILVVSAALSSHGSLRSLLANQSTFQII